MFRFSVFKCVFIAFVMSFSGVGIAESSMEIALSSEASRPAVNDLVQATLSAEATGTALGELSQRVNQTIAEALKTAKAYPAVKAKSGNTNTYPVYAKNGKIESWRSRSDILLESGDPAVMSELLGRLQSSLSLSNLVMMPSPEMRRQAENEATLAAIDLFKARAKALSEALGKSYVIKQLTVGSDNRFVPPMARAMSKTMSFSSETAAMPVEAGESTVSVSVSGKIEVKQ